MRSLEVKSIAGAVLLALVTLSAPAFAQQEPCIGNSAPLTGAAAFGGTAIKMGAEIAIEEINAKGGVLGEQLRFVQYDDAGAPPRGVDNTRRIAQADNCIAILGGYHSTVALAQVEAVHQTGIPYIGTIAANTAIIENGREPTENLMFRVSGKDKWVAEFLVEKAVERSETGKIAFMYENTGWGNGAVPDIERAIEAQGKELVASETFNWNDQDMSAQVMRIRDAGADTVMLWGLDREGNQILRSMDKVGYNPEIVGAWGLAGNLGELAGPLANGVLVMQTYTFTGEMDEKGQALWNAVQEKYGVSDPNQVKMPSGVANAYDAVHVLAKAIEKAGAYDWEKVHQALCDIEHSGVVAEYKPAFICTDNVRHDAVLPEYYKLTAWHEGKLLPVAETPYAD
jgi:branched-chain amino acid transport system substrate-binding protein